MPKPNTAPMNPSLQSSFFRTAALWLECRMDGVSGPFTNHPDPLIGELDAHAELHLIIKEHHATMNVPVPAPSHPPASLEEGVEPPIILPLTLHEARIIHALLLLSTDSSAPSLRHRLYSKLAHAVHPHPHPHLTAKSRRTNHASAKETE
jgi:hypothetical protein